MKSSAILVQLLFVVCHEKVAAAVRGSPMITGVSDEVNPRKERLLRGAVSQKKANELPVAGKRRVLQMDDGKKADTKPQDLLPTVDDIPFMDDTLFDDAFWQDDNCKLVTFNETFYFTAAVERDATGAIGERYYFDNDLNRTDGSQVEDVKLTGVCTRIRLPGDLGTSGAGTCNWVIYHTAGNWSMSASGILQSAATLGIGGSMAVTGGTGEMVSIMGQMDVWPMDVNGMLAIGDIFDIVYGYYVNAIYGLLICPRPYQMTPIINSTDTTTPTTATTAQATPGTTTTAPPP